MVPAALLALGFPKPPDYSVLSRRLSSLQSDESAVSCLLLDSMLPRQRAEVQFVPPVATVLRAIQQAPGERTLVVLGMDRRRGEILRRGVEVRAVTAGTGTAAQHREDRSAGEARDTRERVPGEVVQAWRSAYLVPGCGWRGAHADGLSASSLTHYSPT